MPPLRMELIPVRPSFNANNEMIQNDKSLSLKLLFESLDFSAFWPLLMPKYSLNGWAMTIDLEAMFKALLLKEMWKIDSRRKLVKLLESNEHLLGLCGFHKAPAHNTFSKFVRRLGADVFERTFYELVAKIRECQEVGRIMAIDSTFLEGYCRDWNNGENSDPDAKWGYSTTKEWIFGYKVHLACYAELELPLAFTVTPANVYDSQECFTLLSKIARSGIKFEYVVADAGYDSRDNYYVISHIYHSVPIIAMNRRNLKREAREFRNYLPIKRDVDLWKSLYQERGAVERVFSRLKEELAPKMVKVHRINNVETHVATSLITMLRVALVAIKSGNVDFSKSVNSFGF